METIKPLETTNPATALKWLKLTRNVCMYTAAVPAGCVTLAKKEARHLIKQYELADESFMLTARFTPTGTLFLYPENATS